jgi:SAM-dependent methyltransferase
MRDYKNIDRYITKLYDDVYPQPPDTGHTTLAAKVLDHWLSKLICKTVLDVGAGQGFCQPMFENWDIEYTGIALGEDVLEAQKLGRNVRKMDYSFLEFPDNSFDLIFARHSLEHSPMPVITLMEWNRVSANYLGIVLPHPDWYGYVGLNHYSVMDVPQIKHLLDIAGWHPIWETVDQLVWDTSKEDNPLKNHEIWLMCEKKRG